MTIKRVRLNQNVHEKLLYLKQNSSAKSINDVIESLLPIVDASLIDEGIIKAENKMISFKYDNGKLVEIKIEVNKY